jgi:hypothetical protein
MHKLLRGKKIQKGKFYGKEAIRSCKTDMGFRLPNPLGKLHFLLSNLHVEPLGQGWSRRRDLLVWRERGDGWRGLNLLGLGKKLKNFLKPWWTATLENLQEKGFLGFGERERWWVAMVEREERVAKAVAVWVLSIVCVCVREREREVEKME